MLFQIYPSEFGLERMKEDEEKGPIELTTMKVENDEDLNEEVNKQFFVFFWQMILDCDREDCLLTIYKNRNHK